MKTLEEIKTIIHLHKQELVSRYKIKSLSVFGSYVRNEQKVDSDLDLLVEFSEPIGLFHFVRAEEYLSNILDYKVDLVQKGAMKPHIEQRVLKELVEVL
jgi:predicted nucleotidyltransferase